MILFQKCLLHLNKILSIEKLKRCRVMIFHDREFFKKYVKDKIKVMMSRCEKPQTKNIRLTRVGYGLGIRNSIVKNSEIYPG